jgi:hypothetical protein
MSGEHIRGIPRTYEKEITLADTPYTLSVGFNCVKVDTTGGNVRVNLPDVNYPIDVIKTSSDSYIVTVWVGGVQKATVAGELSKITVENAEVTADEPWYPYDVIVGIAGDEILAKNKYGKVISRGVAGEDDAAFVSSILSSDSNVLVLSDMILTSEIFLTNLSNCNLIASPGVCITRNVASNLSAISINGCDNVRVDGFEFTQADSKYSYMVAIKASSNISFINNIFHDFHAGITSSVYDGVRSKHININDNIFYNYRYVCISVNDGCDIVSIDGNYIYTSSGDGVNGALYCITTSTIGGTDPDNAGSTFIRVTRNVILDHLVHNAIDVHGGDDIYIEENRIINVPNGAAIIMHNTGGVGIPTVDNHNWHIEKNVIETCNQGIVIQASHPDSTVTHVTILGNCVSYVKLHSIYVEPNAAYTNVSIIGIIIEHNFISGHIGTYLYSNGIFVKKDVAAVSNIIADIDIADNMFSDIDDIYSAITARLVSGYLNIHDNNMVGSSDFGILGVLSASCNIGDNFISGPLCGISLLSGVRCLIKFNQIISHTSIDINDADSVNFRVLNNDLSATTVAVSFANAISPIIRDNIGYISPGESRSASGLLTAGVANAIAFAWHNPELQDILIKKVTIRITTPGGIAGSLLDVGIADDAAGTNRGTEFFDDIDLNTAAIIKSTVATPGTQTVEVFCQDSVSATDGWIVGQILVENAASLVGSYYIEYEGA